MMPDKACAAPSTILNLASAGAGMELAAPRIWITDSMSALAE